MRFAMFVIVAVIVGTPAIAYAQEPEHPEAEKSVAEEYASKGTIEAGGSIGFSFIEDVKTVTANPTIGYFIADRFEISGIFALVYTREDDDETGMTDTSIEIALLAEPSYHQPIAYNLLVTGGLGVGMGFDGDYFDLELVPSVGIEIIAGTSSVITPAVRVPIQIGQSHGDNDDGDVGTDVGVALDIGITTTW